jgi:hypothetical protein
MRKKSLLLNIDNSDLVNYPDGRIKNNTGSGNGTPVNEVVYGDLHEMKDKLMRRYDITHNNLPDNETNGYQSIEALMALPSKNDFVLNLTSSLGKLVVPLKLNKLEDNESFILKATIDKTTETLIVGSDSIPFSLIFIGDFKAGEYIRMVFTSANVYLIRLVDAVNLDTAVNELLYLKKASQTEEDAGLIDTKSTTPLTNLTSFIKRVIGVDSVNYLATALRNGLYPKEHFEIVAGLGSSDLKNIGWFGGLEVSGGSIGALVSGGNISSATITNTGGGYTTIRCVLQNPMDDTNYEVSSNVQSQASITADNTVGVPVYKIISNTTFDVSIREFTGGTQNLKINMRIYQL